MNKTRIVLAGGSGFLGKCLTDHFVKAGNQVVILSRKHMLDTDSIHYVKWDAKTRGAWEQYLEGVNAIVNLTGKSVDCRYSEVNKQLIYDSRIESTNILGAAISALKNPPKVWINASSATIYRHALDREMDEYTGEIGTGFSVDVCKKWESTFFRAKTPNTRKVALRIAIVLGKSGGALQPLKNLTKIGFGGRQGKGNQFFSWLHEEDFTRIVGHVIHNEQVSGVYNASSPIPVTNKQIMKLIRKWLNVPFGIAMPKWLLEIGAFIIRTETELILKSRRVIPKRLLESGYKFKYNTIDEALDGIVLRK